MVAMVCLVIRTHRDSVSGFIDRRCLHLVVHGLESRIPFLTLWCTFSNAMGGHGCKVITMYKNCYVALGMMKRTSFGHTFYLLI